MILIIFPFCDPASYFSHSDVGDLFPLPISLQDVFNLLPNLNVNELINAFSGNTVNVADDYEMNSDMNICF